MKPTFHAGPVNGPFEDPCIYIRILRESRALLFDLGNLGRLGAADLQKVSDIFITHTHIDHFFGFDMLLRNILKRETPLRLFGPEPLIRCVEGKLNGYTWNLIRDYPLKIEVYEVRDGVLGHASFYAENHFKRMERESAPFQGTLLREPLFEIKALTLSHDIPVMAYTLEEEFHININKAKLGERGLAVGPWLSAFKKALRAFREGAAGEQEFEVGGRRYALDELRDIALVTRGQKIAYVTDVAPAEENIEKIVPFVRGADLLFCEAYFLEKERDRARERHHLTAALAGRIAREARVGGLELVHLSPKYKECPDALSAEAMEAFRGDLV